MKVWITKFAISRGIYQDVVSETQRLNQYVRSLVDGTLYSPGDWFFTEEDAKVNALLRAKKRLAELDNQKRKIKRMWGI